MLKNKRPTQKEISSAMTDFQEGKISREKLREILSIYIYFFPGNKEEEGENLGAQFYLECLPTLDRIIDRFEERGVPFAHYFRKHLKWRLMTLKSKHYQERDRKKILTEIENTSPIVSEDIQIPFSSIHIPAKYTNIFPCDQEGIITSPAHQKRFLFLCLKFCDRLHFDHFTEIARVTKTPLALLHHSVANLRATMAIRKNRIQHLEIRRNYLYFSLRFHQQKGANGKKAITGDRHQKITINLRHRIKKVNSAIHKIPRHVTHRDIALIMRVPKGTVDSSLSCLRHSLLKDFPPRHSS